MTLKKYNLSGEELGEVSIDEAIVTFSANSQMQKDYIVAIRHNQRQLSSNTKGRAQVRCTKKKPHAQKGSGRARQGSFAAPHYKGGGVAHGPKPKFDQHVRINRKERRQAIKAMLAEKIRDNCIHVLDCPAFEAPQTKSMANFLKKLQLDSRKVLFLGLAQSENVNWRKSISNLPKAYFSPVQNINGYDISVAKNIVVFNVAVPTFLEVLQK